MKTHNPTDNVAWLNLPLLDNEFDVAPDEDAMRFMDSAEACGLHHEMEEQDFELALVA